MNKDFNHSYWELNQYFGFYDLIVIGAGIVGLSTAISFKTKNPKARVLVLDRGILPEGASTKNAGFACFGSASELLDDLTKMPDTTVWKTVQMRWDGLNLLRTRLGDKNMAYEGNGGFELFTDKANYEKTCAQIKYLNKSIKNHLGLKDCYSISKKYKNSFKSVKGILFNPYEGQLDSGKMMFQLAKLAFQLGVVVLNNIEVKTILDLNTQVELSTDFGVFRAAQVAVATNGFANELLKLKELVPARAQVLITTPLQGLKIKGTFHFDEGYYYFRNVEDRILFGGGRNLEFKQEKTLKFGLNPRIQAQLESYLKEMILPGIEFKVAQRWTGIMGLGKEKSPIIRKVSGNVLAVVRMGGMGIAIGSKVGEEAAKKLI